MRFLKDHIDARRYELFDVLRVVVGAALFIRGWSYAAMFEDRLMGTPTDALFAWGALGHLIVGAHLVGGVFLIVGLLTRATSAVCLAAVLGAAWFAQASGAGGLDLVVAAGLAIALVALFFAGSGPWSLDARLTHRWLQKREHVRDVDGTATYAP